MHCQFEGAAQVQPYSFIWRGTLSRFSPQPMWPKAIGVPIMLVHLSAFSCFYLIGQKFSRFAHLYKPVERVFFLVTFIESLVSLVIFNKWKRYLASRLFPSLMAYVLFSNCCPANLSISCRLIHRSMSWELKDLLTMEHAWKRYQHQIVASELNDPIWHSSEWQIGSFSSEATRCCYCKEGSMLLMKIVDFHFEYSLLRA